jgi:hypothetical protein
MQLKLCQLTFVPELNLNVLSSVVPKLKLYQLFRIPDLKLKLHVLNLCSWTESSCANYLSLNLNFIQLCPVPDMNLYMSVSRLRIYNVFRYHLSICVVSL